MLSLYFLVFLSLCKSQSSPLPEEQIDEIISGTRRILRGKEVFDTRPYMVYLRPMLGQGNAYVPPNWLCGGVIIDRRYILTSAACIQEVTYFSVVSGTHEWIPPTETNECIENGAMRAVWKCVPRTQLGEQQWRGVYRVVASKGCCLLFVEKAYRYDGNHFNNIRWMVNDIAVVMTEDYFNFNKRVKGCAFAPKKILYNNVSKELEKSGTRGYIAGWGSTSEYVEAIDMIARSSINSPHLQETISIVIPKGPCKSLWLKRYHSIIEKYMICGKIIPTIELTGDCNDKHAACRQLFFSEEEGPRPRRFESEPDKLLLESAAHVKKRQQSRRMDTRRLIRNTFSHGGFCENDHGGPLIVGEGNSAMVLGIMSAYRTQNNSKKCYGPYLYTSVYNNRNLIECALYKELRSSCNSLLRDTATVLEEETVDWGEQRSRVWKFEESLDYPSLRSRNDSSDPVTNGDNGNKNLGTSTLKPNEDTKDKTQP